MIVGISGGLGNQMFKYAFGISVGKARKEPVFFHKRYGLGFDMRHGRKFELDAFQITGRFVDDPSFSFWFDNDRGFNPDVYTVPDGAYFEGCWLSEKYFDTELILREFTLRQPGYNAREADISEKAQSIAQSIQSEPSTFIHIRRGDFLWASESFHGVMSLEYYKKAIAYIRTRNDKMKFFVFSDDPDWCRGTFMGQDVVGTDSAVEDMFLMSLCDNAIIANSSFSWWAAWLGDQRVRGFKRTVIAPRQWYADPTMSAEEWVSQRWVRL